MKLQRFVGFCNCQNFFEKQFAEKPPKPECTPANAFYNFSLLFLFLPLFPPLSFHSSFFSLPFLFTPLSFHSSFFSLPFLFTPLSFHSPFFSLPFLFPPLSFRSSFFSLLPPFSPSLFPHNRLSFFFNRDRNKAEAIIFGIEFREESLYIESVYHAIK